jgi:hypothetical protein
VTSAPSAPAGIQPVAAFFQNETAGNSESSAGFCERRREVRYATNDDVQLSLNGMAGLEISGVLRDVSRNGLRVEVAWPVQTGTRMKVSIRDRAIIFAVARHCRRTLETYQVGASIESVYYPTAGVDASQETLGETGAIRSGQRQLSLDSDPSSREHRDLAGAIIDDHTSHSFGSLNRLADLQPLSDRLI